MNEFYFNRSFWVSVAWSFLEIDWIMLSTCLNDPNQNFESNDESSKAEIFFFFRNWKISSLFSWNVADIFWRICMSSSEVAAVDVL